MIYREAVSLDLEKLNQISVLSKSYWGYPNAWISHWMKDLTLSEKDLNTMKVTVLEKSSQLIGFCAIKDRGQVYEVMHLWLLPKFIGRGYGGELLTKSMEASVTVEKPVIVEADPHAESFYRRHGFKTFDKRESFPKGRFLPLMLKMPSKH